ncbi:Ig-like domain-containing protein [Gottfriedia luciferensis]|uniref:hypothetical protein n=1 Tax=Gottfriedia luciferensis TaxID=178774 RepID=UPI000B440AB2|nr:hypothetical protein [Gottfriedia luciferensis]
MKKLLSYVTLVFLLISLIIPMNKALAYEGDPPPSFDSLTLSSKQVGLEDQLEFNLEQTGSPYFLTDAILTYKKPNGELYPINLFNTDTMYHYSKDITFYNQDDIGSWTLESIELKDDGENHIFLTKEDIPNIENYNFEVIQGTKDTTNPTIHSITFDKAEANAGETNTVFVDTQDESGISSVTMGLISPSGKKRIELYDFHENSNGLWENSFDIPAYTENGQWKVEYVNVWDQKGNQLSINTYESYPENFSTFLVHSENEDIDGPVFQTVEIEKSEMTADESNKIKVKVTDNLTGVSEIGLTFGIDRGEDSSGVPLECKKTDIDSIYECELTIPYYFASGEYQLISAYATDNADNITYLQAKDIPVVGTNLIKLTNVHEDIIAPEFKRLILPTKVVKQTDTQMNVQINAKDLGSGVSGMEVMFENEFGDSVYGYDFNQIDNNTWSSEMNIYQNFHEGTYKIKRLSIYDQAGNQTVREYTDNGVIEYKGSTQTKIENAPEYSFLVLSHSKAIHTARTNIKVQTYSNQTVEVYNGNLLLGSSAANSNGKASISYNSLPKNTRLKVVIKDADGNITEQFFTTIGISDTDIINPA